MSVARRVPRIRLEGRTDLCKAIPLDTPIHLFIDPSAACNFNCKFCFDHKEAFHQIMKWDIFKKVINDCKKFPQKIRAIRLYGFGEPLLNRNIVQMVKYTKDSGITDFVEFTTNGWWLNPDLNLQLVGAGLDAITISVPQVSSTKIKDICGKNVNFQEYYNNIKHFYNNRGQCRVHTKITNYNLSLSDKYSFYRIFQKISTEISVDNIVPIWPEMHGDIRDVTKNIYNLPVKPVSVCPYIFYHLTVHSNGDISTCFVDWKHKNILGNIQTDPIVDTWNGKELHRIQLEHLHGIKQGICKECGQLKYGQADNIDRCKDRIIKRMVP